MPSVNPITRPAAVAGSFYPAQTDRLRSSVQALLKDAQARIKSKNFSDNPKALIVPHAGYIYSGNIAASAYASLPAPEKIRRVLLLGPAHRMSFRGVASPDCDRFETPLGEIPLDTRALYQLKQKLLIADDKKAHHSEHSLEVQLPYLQETLGKFELVPLLIGNSPPQLIAQIIDDLVDEYLQEGLSLDNFLTIVSSDLSHFHEYHTANTKDRSTSEAICRHSSSLNGDEACGCRAINGLMMSDFASRLSVQCIERGNSGDTCGNKDRVVGYGAFALTNQASSDTTIQLDENPTVEILTQKATPKKQDTSTHKQEPTKPETGLSYQPIKLKSSEKRFLLNLARSAIEHHLNPGIKLLSGSIPEIVNNNWSCFVTLKKQGELRGCMGALQAYQPLYFDVIEHAQSAAFRDYRYQPVIKDELTFIDIEISVLSSEHPIDFSSEKDFLKQMIPGQDGITIESGPHRATFLPAVWDQLKTADEFLLHLKQKAGLSVGAWPDDIKAWRYSTAQFSEKDFT